MTPYAHAESSAREFGGVPEDYMHLHNWLDETKQYTGDWTHRALRHHAAGVQWMVDEYGHYLENSDGEVVPMKLIAETHVIEDCGYIPTVADWLSLLKEHPDDWMLKVKTKRTEQLVVEGD
jgi:hypothetical protein